MSEFGVHSRTDNALRKLPKNITPVLLSRPEIAALRTTLGSVKLHYQVFVRDALDIDSVAVVAAVFVAGATFAVLGAVADEGHWTGEGERFTGFRAVGFFLVEVDLPLRGGLERGSDKQCRQWREDRDEHDG